MPNMDVSFSELNCSRMTNPRQSASIIEGAKDAHLHFPTRKLPKTSHSSSSYWNDKFINSLTVKGSNRVDRTRYCESSKSSRINISIAESFTVGFVPQLAYWYSVIETLVLLHNSNKSVIYFDSGCQSLGTISHSFTLLSNAPENHTMAGQHSANSLPFPARSCQSSRVVTTFYNSLTFNQATSLLSTGDRHRLRRFGVWYDISFIVKDL
ncbi:hypothetical protein V1508DRAFT_435134 [Lipomyces doorenjongii]|uniref:uncharacterized protein n=1 Tax=Lipomyces doorenjongii TaxID=383834 RepID=UPI0034CFEA36